MDIPDECIPLLCLFHGIPLFCKVSFGDLNRSRVTKVKIENTL